MGYLEENKELIEDVVTVLGHVWRRVNWRAVTRGRRSAYDVFQHRLMSALREPTFPRFFQKLCHGLNLQAPKVPVEIFDRIDKQEQEALTLMRDMTQYLTYRAREKALEIKEQMKNETIKKEEE